MTTKTKKLTLNVPTSWEDITLEQYVKLVALSSKWDLQDADQLLEYKLDQVLILNPDLTREDLLLMTLPQLKEYFNKIDFLNTEPVLRDCKTLKIDGKEYQFQDFKLLSLEQWIDAEKYTTLDQAHKLIAIFYISAADYDAAEHDKVSNYLLKAPATEYFWSVSFFLFIHKAYGLAMERYSKIVMEADKIAERARQVERFKQKLLKRFGFR